MNKPNLGGIFKKLGVLKDFMSLVVPVVISIVAVVLIIISQLMGGKLTAEMEKESISRANNVKTLLESVPPLAQADVERKYQEEYANDANHIMLLLRQTTERELLHYGVFPEPNEKSEMIFKQFGQSFNGKINEIINRLKGSDCPTKDEIDKAMQSTTVGGVGSPYRGGISSYSSFSSGTSTGADIAIKNALCTNRANSASVYINPRNIEGYDLWTDYKVEVGWKESLEDCWYWQLGYWAMEDVLNTVEVMNQGSKSVLTSPVKRVINISFTELPQGGYSTSTVTSAASSVKKVKPRYVTTLYNGLTEPCTGRLCNADIDVIHFNVVVVVNSKDVMRFIAALCSGKEHKFKGFFGEKPQEQTFHHNQITILENSVSPVDRNDADNELYRYGDDSVVHLELICEYVFDKTAYDAIKPQSVKDWLANPPTTLGY